MTSSENLIQQDFDHLWPNGLQDQSFEGYTFEESKGSGLLISDCVFSNCRFIACDFASTTFIDCRFSRCQFARDDLTDPSRLRFCSFEHCRLEACDLSGIDCSESNWYGSELKQTRALGLKAQGISNEKQINDRLSLRSLSAVGCDFSLSDFSSARLISSTFADCNFFDSALVNSNFETAAFLQCDLNQIDWFGANITGCDLTESQFDTIDVKHQDLRGVKISRFQLDMLTQPLGIDLID